MSGVAEFPLKRSRSITTVPGAQMSGGAYEAASRQNRELAMWAPPIQSVDADIIPSKERIDSRAIDLARNDGFVSSAISFHKDAVIGGQFMLNCRPDTVALGLDEVWEEEFQAEVESLFTNWAESPRNWVDASRRNTFTSMLRLCVGIYLYAGEVLLTSEWIDRESEPFRPFHTCFQMIELSRLSNPMFGTVGTRRRRTRAGVEIDSYGAPVAYHIRRMTPGDLPDLYGASLRTNSWARVRAVNSFGRPQVVHVMEQQRPGQTRGVSQMVAGLKEMRVTQRFRDIILQNAVVNATFAASIESELPKETVYEALGAGDSKKKITDYADAYLGAIAEYAAEGRGFQLDGAKIPHFYPGTKLNLHPMGRPGGIGTEFEAALVRHTAATLDMSYEELSRDYSKTNYSSSRSSAAVTFRAMTSRKRMVAERVAYFVFRNWFEEALNAGRITTMNAARIPNFYENEEAFLRCSWIGGARGQIDEEKETKAAVARLEAGLSTWEDELAHFGKDWRQVYRQLRREMQVREELGLSFTTSEVAAAVAEAAPEPEPGTGVDDRNTGAAE